MKFFTFVALIAAASAVRVSQESTPEFTNTFLQEHLDAEAEAKWDEAQKGALKAWLWKKANSNGKLTWKDLSAEITRLKTMNGGAMTADKLKQYKKSFDDSDTQGDGVLGPLELRGFMKLRGMI